MAEIVLGRSGRVALIDDSDYDHLKQHKWRVARCNQNAAYTYAATRIAGRFMLMHRFILNAPASKLVDHINGDRLDNRRCNLRLCTHAENQRNGKRPSNNTSGFKGVHWRKDRQRWYAEIYVNNARVHLGCYQSKEAAAEAYRTAALKYHGEFARFQ